MAKTAVVKAGAYTDRKTTVYRLEAEKCVLGISYYTATSLTVLEL